LVGSEYFVNVPEPSLAQRQTLCRRHCLLILRQELARLEQYQLKILVDVSAVTSGKIVREFTLPRWTRAPGSLAAQGAVTAGWEKAEASSRFFFEKNTIAVDAMVVVKKRGGGVRVSARGNSICNAHCAMPHAPCNMPRLV
jgi:hypothetical protein